MTCRESYDIIGRIIDRTATERDLHRLEHLSWLQAHRLKQRHDDLSPIERIMLNPRTLAKSPSQIKIILEKIRGRK